MAGLCARNVLLALAVALAAMSVDLSADGGDAPVVELNGDDECTATGGEACAVNALQRRAFQKQGAEVVRRRMRELVDDVPAAAAKDGGWVVTNFAPPPDAKREKCGQIEDNVEYGGTTFLAMLNVGSEHMCCATCAGFPECEAWSWGKTAQMVGLTHVCWLKKLGGKALVKNRNIDLMSGVPSKEVRKFGVLPPPKSRTSKMEGVVPKLHDATPATTKCLGSLSIEGYGQVALINAGMNTPTSAAGPVEVAVGDLIVPGITGRAYFGAHCSEGPYKQDQYAKLNLLGKTMSWTTDISGTGCGCNAALYLTSMAQSSAPGKCKGDFYCDAMNVCGVQCAEVDLQEANQHSWMSTLHAYNPAAGADTLGVARGYGGSYGEPSRRDWSPKDYGPDGRCIDTQKPFRVAVSFPVDQHGNLASMSVKLTQAGRPCSLETNMSDYQKGGHKPMAELTEALRQGMTPVVSYWSSYDMLWMDGLGADGLGPCVRDEPKTCPNSTRFYGFSIHDMEAKFHHVHRSP